MNSQPELTTDRLLLRGFTLEDAPAVQRLAGAPEVAATTLLIPHPYPVGEAEKWISTHKERIESGDEFRFAITLKKTGELIGAIGIGKRPNHNKAEIGYWIGVPYWGNGYCTEAALAVIGFGFLTLELNRIFASHFLNNPASGRVIQKTGMQFEGILRQDLLKDGVYIDHALYAITRDQFMA